MSTDRELLELAARAAGKTGEWSKTIGGWDCLVTGGGDPWQPLHERGQALSLAIALGLSLEPYPYYDSPKHSVIVKQRRRGDQLREGNPTEVVELYRDHASPELAACRAIVRCAALSLQEPKP